MGGIPEISQEMGEGMETHTNEGKGNFLNGGLVSRKKSVILVIGLMTLVLLVGLWVNKSSTAYAVYINGKETLVFEKKAQADLCIQDFLKQKSQEIGKNVTTDDKIEIKEIKVNKKDQILAADKGQLLEEQLNILVPGAAIVINGEEKAVLADKKTAEDTINKIRGNFTPQGEELKIVKVDIKEDVQVVEKKVPIKKIIDSEKAFQLLTIGSEKIETYIVEEGESLWSIARKNNMKMEDLEEANPDYNPDKLQIGDEINLVKMEPMLHVTAVAEFAEVKKVPFEVEVKNDNSMLRGKEKVKQEGQDGKKEFKYRIVQENGKQVDKQFIAGTVIAQPVNKVVVKGTKLILASRGSGGSGDLRWPTRGAITSRFGYRGREYHTGLDIDGSTGDPVYAAESGTVTYVGRDGNYGKIIRISHGNGIQTWYAHLSAYEVSSGTKVDRGELIGRVGNTGRSTGSHLHFEVRINGNAVNPLKYLD